MIIAPGGRKLIALALRGSTGSEILTLSQLYRDRADCENTTAEGRSRAQKRGQHMGRPPN
jgi:hypothetical protein